VQGGVFERFCNTTKLKNSTGKRNFKSKGTRCVCVGNSDILNDTKKHTTKSRETIPLRAIQLQQGLGTVDSG
jgi:hypothetical protein